MFFFWGASVCRRTTKTPLRAAGFTPAVLPAALEALLKDRRREACGSSENGAKARSSEQFVPWDISIKYSALWIE